ncbi:MAG: GNAT family N-acetyltransferase [Elainellaceae cyanobacterium]
MFRRATQADVPALLGLVQAFYQESNYPFDRAKAQRSLALLIESPHFGQACLIKYGGECPSGELFEARPAAITVGYAILTFGFSLEYGGRDAILDELYICPKSRNRGLGTAAIAYLESVCLAEGIGALHLEVERDNSAASLYRRLGFEAHNRDFMTKGLTE